MHNDRSPCCTLPFTLLGGAGFAESLFLMINRWHELGIELPTLPTSVVSAWAPAARVWGRDTRGEGLGSDRCLRHYCFPPTCVGVQKVRLHRPQETAGSCQHTGFENLIWFCFSYLLHGCRNFLMVKEMLNYVSIIWFMWVRLFACPLASVCALSCAWIKRTKNGDNRG